MAKQSVRRVLPTKKPVGKKTVDKQPTEKATPSPEIIVLGKKMSNKFKLYLANTRTTSVSLVATLPLLMLYNLGLMIPGHSFVNRLDFLSGFFDAKLRLWGMLGLNFALGIISIISLIWLVKKRKFALSHFAFLIIEGTILGLIMGMTIPWILGKALSMSAAGGPSYSFADVLAISAGAGYWEELVFRLILVGGSLFFAAKILKRQGKNSKWLVLIGGAAVVASALLFSLVHHSGAQDLPIAYEFWYRVVAGVIFGAIFLARGFASAAYTHFMYDVLVMLFWK